MAVISEKELHYLSCLQISTQEKEFALMIFSLHLVAEYETHYPGFRSLLQAVLRLNFTAVVDQSRPSLLGDLHYIFHQMKSSVRCSCYPT